MKILRKSPIKPDECCIVTPKWNFHFKFNLADDDSLLRAAAIQHLCSLYPKPLYGNFGVGLISNIQELMECEIE